MDSLGSCRHNKFTVLNCRDAYGPYMLAVCSACNRPLSMTWNLLHPVVGRVKLSLGGNYGKRNQV